MFHSPEIAKTGDIFISFIQNLSKDSDGLLLEYIICKTIYEY